MGRYAFSIIWLMVFTIPWSNMILIPGLGTISYVLGPPVLAVGILATLYHQKIRFHLMHGVMLTFGLWLFITYFWSIDPYTSQLAIISYTQNIILAWLIFQWATRIRQVNALLAAYVLGAYIAVGAVIFGFVSGEQNAVRYTATGFNANNIACIMALGIPMAWYLTLNKTKAILVWIYRIYPAFALFAILLTASRGGFIVAVVGLFFIFFSYRGLPFLNKFILLSIAATTALLLTLYVPVESFNRIDTIGSEVASGSLNSRVDIWVAGLHAIGEHPMGVIGVLWGIGVGCFPHAIAPILFYASAHNVFLSMLVEVGVIGFLLFTAILFVALLSTQRMPRLERLLWLVLLSQWGIAAMTSNMQWRKETWLLFALLAAHAAALRIQKKTMANNEIKNKWAIGS